MTALRYPSTERNREPILEVLRGSLPERARILEVASGSGEHAVFFAEAMPGWSWTPSDPAPEAQDSIVAWTAASGLSNVAPPLPIDCLARDSWPETEFDALLAVNMIHISPWAATEGLLDLTGSVLKAGGALILYGPYIEADVKTAPSNLAFDADLRRRNPDWGLRDRDRVIAAAAERGLQFKSRFALPANNIALVLGRP